MNVETAIEIINDVTWEDDGRYYGRINSARDLAISALEKQVPKKPITETVEHFQCPTCENVTMPPCEGNVGLKYCGYCGQKVDRSEVKN